MRRKNKFRNPLITLFLALPASVYGLGFLLFRLFSRQKKVERPVISIGNITAGGTGKTPAVMSLIEYLTGRMNITVLTRGYGRRTKGLHIASSDDKMEEIGDEAVMIKRRYPAVGLAACSDRFKSARAAIDMGSDILILDDGFQSFELIRDLDIVMIDSTFPFGGGLLIPAGFLREPLASLKRADCIMLHRYDLAAVQKVAAIEGKIRHINPHAVIFHSREKISSFRALDTGQTEGPAYFAGKEVFCFSGIGNPRGFYNLLKRSDAVIIDKIEKADHYPWKKEDLDPILKRISDREICAVTTEKDAARINSPLKDVWEMRMDMHIEEKKDFEVFINAKIV